MGWTGRILIIVLFTSTLGGACGRQAQPAGPPTTRLGAADQSQGQGQGPPIDRAQCDMPIGGVPWAKDGPEVPVEAAPDYDQDLAALAPDIAALPAALDTSRLPAFFRAVIAYALDVDSATLATTLDRDAVGATGEMGRAVLAAFASAQKQGLPGIDFVLLRRGLHRFYSCQQKFPLTLDGFRQGVFDYMTLPGTVVDSYPKGGPRRLRANDALRIYVAETLIDDDKIRETEIQLASSRPDGAIDFIVYGADGRLTDRSEFASPPGNHMGQKTVAASPYACMSCHIDTATNRFDVVMPQHP